jgi:hypothetical protein
MDTTKHGNSSERGSGDRRVKKQYLKPAFQYERVFETQALACVKKAGVAHCDMSTTKNS